MRATSIQHVQRTNLAVSLLHRQTPAPTVLARLMARYQLSRRQAYRYLAQAIGQSAPLPVPGVKTVFTVKLPLTLVSQIRRQAQRQEQRLSDWVAQALQDYLQRGPPHGCP